MEMALSFNDVTLTPILYHGTPWIRAADLSRALWGIAMKARCPAFFAAMPTNLPNAP